MKINAKLPWLNKNIALYLSDYASTLTEEENREQINGNRMKHCLIEILRTCTYETFISIMRYLQTTPLAANKIAFFLERIAELSNTVDDGGAIKEEIEYQRWVHAGGYRAHTITIYLLDQPWNKFSNELIENLPK